MDDPPPNVEVPVMEFRWVAGLTLWTMLSGPILSQPSPPRPTVVAAQPVFAPANPATVLSSPQAVSYHRH
jgi:hypothetical protein